MEASCKIVSSARLDLGEHLHRGCQKPTTLHHRTYIQVPKLHLLSTNPNSEAALLWQALVLESYVFEISSNSIKKFMNAAENQAYRGSTSTPGFPLSNN